MIVADETYNYVLSELLLDFCISKNLFQKSQEMQSHAGQGGKLVETPQTPTIRHHTKHFVINNHLSPSFPHLVWCGSFL